MTAGAPPDLPAALLCEPSDRCADHIRTLAYQLDVPATSLVWSPETESQRGDRGSIRSIPGSSFSETSWSRWSVSGLQTRRSARGKPATPGSCVTLRLESRAAPPCDDNCTAALGSLEGADFPFSPRGTQGAPLRNRTPREMRRNPLFRGRREDVLACLILLHFYCNHL